MSIAKEPRQMMINMMYLVLTALLALNISAEILNAFYSVNGGIVETKKAIETQNNLTYAALAKQAEINPEKAQKVVEAANQVKQISIDFEAYVEALKDELVTAVGGNTETDYIEEGQAKNLDAASRIFVKLKKGDDLETRIRNDRDQLLSIIASVDPEVRANFESTLALSIKDPKVAEGDEEKADSRTWAQKNFEMVPSIAALIVLNSLQNDMKNAEADIINWLLSQIGATDFKFDQLKASIIPKKPFVTVGEKFSADIFVSASSSASNPKVYIGSLDPSIAVKDENDNYKEIVGNNPVKNPTQTLDAIGGIVKYEMTASGEGINRITGAIEVKNESTGEIKYYPFETEYQSAKPMAVVSPDKMNVLYIGVDNPLSVSVPGFQAEMVSASITEGSITGGKGKYVAKVTKAGTVKVNVSAKLDDGTTKAIGAAEFRVKRVPDPIAKLGKGTYEKGGKVQAGTFKAQSGIRAELENFDFELKFNIISYEVTYVAKRQDPISSENNGGGFSSKVQEYVQKAKPGDVFYFDQIKAKGPDGLPRTLPSLVFQLI
jgi:hypothetical protein